MIHDRSQLQRRTALGAQDLQAQKRLLGLQKTQSETVYQSATAKSAAVDLQGKTQELAQIKKSAALQVERATPSIPRAEIFRNIKSSVSNWVSSIQQKLSKEHSVEIFESALKGQKFPNSDEVKSPENHEKLLKEHPVEIFESAFKGKKFPNFDEVKSRKNLDPKTFNACLRMLEGTKVGNAISFMEEFEKLQSNSSLEKIMQLKEKFVIDPSKDDPFVFSDLEEKGLNIYQSTYNNFDGKFKKAIDDLKENKNTGDLSAVLAAFTPIFNAAEADASRNFHVNAQAAISKYHESQPSSGQPSPPSFA